MFCPALVTPWNIAHSVHGILQARILEWDAISFTRGSSRPRDQTHISYAAGRLLHCRVSHLGSSVRVCILLIMSIVYCPHQLDHKFFKDSFFVFSYIYIYMHACMHVYIHICMYTYMWICIWYMYVCVYVCIHICMHICALYMEIVLNRRRHSVDICWMNKSLFFSYI